MQPDKVRVVWSPSALIICLPWHSARLHPPAHFSRTKKGSDFLPATFFASHLWTRSNVIIAPVWMKKSQEAQWIETWLRKTQATLCQSTEAVSPYSLLIQQSFLQVFSEDQMVSLVRVWARIFFPPSWTIFSPPCPINFPYDHWLGKWKERPWESPRKGTILLRHLHNTDNCAPPQVVLHLSGTGEVGMQLESALWLSFAMEARIQFWIQFWIHSHRPSASSQSPPTTNTPPDIFCCEMHSPHGSSASKDRL